MHIEFLWDGEKTRKLFKSHIILFLIGSALASVYTLTLPSSTPYYLAIIIIPVLFHLSCYFYYFFTLKSVHPGYWFLLFTLESQLAVAFFMAVTGGFLGIIQFAPYMLLLFAVFELGFASTLILGIFAVLTFIAIFAWQVALGQENVIQNSLYYVGSYILILVIEGRIGKELSLQFEAKRKLEHIDTIKSEFMVLTSQYLHGPITEIKQDVTGLLQDVSLSALQKSSLEKIAEGSSDLESLVEKLLFISNIKGGNFTPTFTPTLLVKMISGILSEFETVATSRGVKLFFLPTIDSTLMVPLDNSMHNALRNIIENAIKFNRPEGRVTVYAALEQETVSISIADTGTGLTPEQLENLFEPFRKGVQKAPAGSEGIGISLYFAKIVTEMHGGILSVRSEVGGGSVFTIQLPMPKSIIKQNGPS